MMQTDTFSTGTCGGYIPNVGPDLQNHDCEQTQPRLETILLVEDESYVLDITREVLEMCGYTVRSAKDAREAIRIFDESEENIHLLVTDVVMPGMNGRELAQRLIERSPQLKAIFISGYTDNAVVRNGFRDANTVYLQKPFTLEALARKVREVIDGKAIGSRPARMN
jgi:two-component system, cell cycle sensor histidine kinase and response regulator CckA